ncbi:fused response regulator/phosphatase [Jatrophihabitans sp.]|uniref:PP2C family protein-serine/threonine phosphatase n=1 Tax=Jatrophihabitans sp. TaxID=1932789 RepID=UPI0030C6D103|nr:fused response regulator/phosphatase [Jatrophihabitans sp.]
MSDAPARVLLVEDDEGDALLVRECLREAGLTEPEISWQRTLGDGLAALATPPECVLLDLGLPDAEGLGALYRIVAAAGEVPVIVLTGRHDRTGDDAVAAGAQDYLVKDDITPELLDRSIRYARERKRAQRAELRLRAEQSQTAERARLERGLLPTPLLHGDRITCATYYQPGSDLAVLGGDFFDVVETPDGRIRAVIGDVMGHGPDEAALGVHLRVAWRTLVLAGAPDDWILGTLARLLHAESGDSGPFVTVCDLSIELDSTVSLRVAGHPAPLLCANGETRYLEAAVGPPLGVQGLAPQSATTQWPETRTSLPSGSSLILYTDGLLDGYRPLTDDGGLGVAELLNATDRCVSADNTVESWLPGLVDSAPARSDDDTAVVVLTSRS